MRAKGQNSPGAAAGPGKGDRTLLRTVLQGRSSSARSVPGGAAPGGAAPRLRSELALTPVPDAEGRAALREPSPDSHAGSNSPDCRWGQALSPPRGPGRGSVPYAVPAGFCRRRRRFLAGVCRGGGLWGGQNSPRCCSGSRTPQFLGKAHGHLRSAAPAAAAQGGGCAPVSKELLEEESQVSAGRSQGSSVSLWGSHKRAA